MVERRIKNVGGRNAFVDQVVNGLQKQRRLANLARTGEQQCSPGRWVLDPSINLPKGSAPPWGKIGKSATRPPRVVLAEDGEHFRWRGDHLAENNKKSIFIQI